jgi:putative acetyltransferase
MGISSERVTISEGFINGLTDNDHMLGAEVENNGVKRVV